MKAITAGTRAEAWLQALNFLRHEPERRAHNVILEIEDPAATNNLAAFIESEAERFLSEHGKQPLFTIAETIFPAWEYAKHGVEGVFEIYPKKVYPELKHHPRVSWGTYAHRLLVRKGPKGEPINPLEQCIKKINNELSHKGAKPACYEIGLSDYSLELPTYDSTTDGNKHLNMPCLSHLSFKLGPERRLYLTALYRSHFYVERTLGNQRRRRYRRHESQDAAIVPATATVSVVPYSSVRSRIRDDATRDACGWLGGVPTNQLFERLERLRPEYALDVVRLPTERRPRTRAD